MVVECNLIQFTDEELNPRLLRRIIIQRPNAQWRSLGRTRFALDTFCCIELTVDVHLRVVAAPRWIESDHNMSELVFDELRCLINVTVSDAKPETSELVRLVLEVQEVVIATCASELAFRNEILSRSASFRWSDPKLDGHRAVKFVHVRIGCHVHVRRTCETRCLIPRAFTRQQRPVCRHIQFVRSGNSSCALV